MSFLGTQKHGCVRLFSRVLKHLKICTFQFLCNTLKYYPRYYPSHYPPCKRWLRYHKQRWYHSGGKAAKALGLNVGNVSKVCKGIYTHTGGQHFRFTKEDEKEILYAAVANGTFKWGDEWVNPGGSNQKRKIENKSIKIVKKVKK